LLTILSTRSFLFLIILPILFHVHPDRLAGQDTLQADSVVRKRAKTQPLEAKVDFSARDSIRFELNRQQVFLYQEADIKYKDIELKADFITIDFPQNLVHANGVPDSAGKLQGIPKFKQADQEFESREINYNYTTKRGYIQNVFTKQDQGYLHGTEVKKMENDITYMKSGAFTTCDRKEHPHFAFKFTKAKVIPGKKVVTGPAYMEIAEAATPIVIPFGLFPNRTGQRSGIILPTYGESANRGFFFENLGYYWAINQYMDLKIQADIFTRGSWAIKPTYSYKKRYKYYGTLNFSYAVNILYAPEDPNYERREDFRVVWQHSQDPKARPHSKFSASVNIVSNTFNKYNLASSTEAYLSNEFQSSVNYSTSFAGKYFLNLNFNHRQNTLNKTISLTLPQIAFSVNQFYPFRRAIPSGKVRWYENIGMKYNLDAENRYNTYDSLFLQPGWEQQMQNGIRHTIPISASLRVLKFFNWTTSISINDRMYFQTIRKRFQADTLYSGSDTIPPGYKTDTVYRFANEFDMNFSTSLNTRLYGMYRFKKGPIVAFRHMLTPSVGFTYTPNWGAPWLGYWREVENDTNATPGRYCIFSGGIYGSPPGEQSGMLSLALSNNLEMKVRNRKDTVTGVRKIPLIDDFTLRISYDVAKDSLRWSPLTMSGRSTLFKGLTIQYGSTWDFYARDSLGNRINTSEWNRNHRIIRLDNTSWDIGLSYSLSSDKVKGKKQPTKGTPQEQQDVLDYYDYYVDFDIPWSFTINYNFRYSKNYNAYMNARVEKIVQTLNFTGQLNITPKWKISLTTGWDFDHGQLAYTSIDLYRDLHCWEMRFGWIPKGAQQSWNFSINVKASLLQDLKLNKKKDFRDIP
jgi:lipopolysaccharide assembly outer membrane protein LptD (OstA)